jgi:DNA polymerase III epsilon subunit-like protein
VSLVNPAARPETFISVDIETAGPTPREYSLLSIGACLVHDPDETFYVELKPVTSAVNERAMAVGGFTLEALAESGVEPRAAMERFDAWIAAAVPEGHVPVFVAFNAVFDWMFVQDYFQRYLGRNPFGHSGLDVKAYYMGMTGETWARTSMRYLSPRYLGGTHLSHNALHDARDQALIFRTLLEEATRHPRAQEDRMTGEREQPDDH